MTTPWSHLPNAQHIDWVLADLKQNPETWAAAWDAARAATRAAAWDAARVAARAAAWDAARDATRGAAWDAARDATRGAARDAAWGAILALIAYDDCAHMPNLEPNVLRAMYKLTGDPAALLLLPAVIVRSER